MFAFAAASRVVAPPSPAHTAGRYRRMPHILVSNGARAWSPRQYRDIANWTRSRLPAIRPYCRGPQALPGRFRGDGGGLPLALGAGTGPAVPCHPAGPAQAPKTALSSSTFSPEAPLPFFGGGARRRLGCRQPSERPQRLRVARRASCGITAPGP